MLKTKITISIIILHYKVPEFLKKCIESIYKYPPKIPFEIIVVDNDENKSLPLKKEFPDVVYIPTEKNIGFGAGFNRGVEKAQGKYILFLNPDTQITKNAIFKLYLFLLKNKNIGMASSLLVNEKGEVNPLCATDLLTPKRAFFLHSFLRKLFIKTKTARDFYVKNYSAKEPIYKDAVQTASFMMQKEVFKKIGGFDERFFLFFEEYDLAQKLKKQNLKSVIIPTSIVIHKGGESMKQKKNTQKDFEKSRYVYFKKYYGFAVANILDFFLRTSFWSIPMVFILGLAAFLAFYKLPVFMVFISDQGWFYNSAKDMILTGAVPLVGIPSSHAWLSQGPLWTYIISILFYLFRFDPLAPGFFTAGMFVATVFLVYLVGKTLFSKPVGTVSALLYATSPLVLIGSRMPYQTSLIPFFFLLFLYSVYTFIRGSKYFFPISLFLLGILYNLEIASVILFGFMFAILLFGFVAKKQFTNPLKNVSFLLVSFLSLIIPFIPILIYDVQNGYPHTFKFVAWLGYRVLRFFGFFPHALDSSFTEFASQSILYIQRLVFLPSREVALVLFFSVLLGFTVLHIFDVQKRKTRTSEMLLGLFTSVFLISYLLNKTPSEAYWHLFFPIFFLMSGFLIVRFSKSWILALIFTFLVLGISFLNASSLLSQNYLLNVKNGYGIPFSARMEVSKILTGYSKKRPYNLVTKGSENYRYLNWYLGHEPSLENQKLKFKITDSYKDVSLDIRDENK